MLTMSLKLTQEIFKVLNEIDCNHILKLPLIKDLEDSKTLYLPKS